MKEPVDAANHVSVLYKLATVSLLDAFLHSCDEAALIFEHSSNSVFNQLLGVLAIGKGHLLEPRFNLGRKMYFHAFKVRENRERGNREAMPGRIRGLWRITWRKGDREGLPEAYEQTRRHPVRTIIKPAALRVCASPT